MLNIYTPEEWFDSRIVTDFHECFGVKSIKSRMYYTIWQVYFYVSVLMPVFYQPVSPSSLTHLSRMDLQTACAGRSALLFFRNPEDSFFLC